MKDIANGEGVFDPPLELLALYWVKKGDVAGTERRIVVVHTIAELEDYNSQIMPELTPKLLEVADSGFWRWAVALPTQLALHCLEVTGHLTWTETTANGSEETHGEEDKDGRSDAVQPTAEHDQEGDGG